MSTASGRWPGGTWAILLSLLLCLDLVTCQGGGTYRLTSTPASFIGFFQVNPTSVSQYACGSTLTWDTSSTSGGCCTTTACQKYTACNNGVLTRRNGTHATCDASNPVCGTQTIFPSSPHLNGATSWVRYACFSVGGQSVTTAYREIMPRETATVTLTADGTTITAGPFSSSFSSSSFSSSSSTAPKTSQPDEPPDTEEASDAEPGADPGQGVDLSKPTGTPPPAASAAATESQSKAWIAGAVVGPLIGLTALGILLFWLGKRRGERKIGTGGRTELEQQLEAGAPPLYDPGPDKHEMPVYYQGPGEHPPQRYSLPPPVHELAPAEMAPQELAGR